MLLDLYPRDQASQLEEYSRLPVLPRDLAGFGEMRGLSYQDNLNQALPLSRARNEYNMWSDALDKLYLRTGREVPNPAVARPEVRPRIEAMAREALAAARAEHPDLPNPDDFEAQIAARVQAEHQAFRGAEQVATFGGQVGSFVGAAEAFVSDPVNIATMWLGAPRAAGVLATAGREFLINAGTQAATEAIAAPYRKELGITDVSSVENILTAGVGGAVLGGSARALVRMFDRLRLGREVDVPPAIRDARNVAEAAQRLADSNPFDRTDLPIHSEALKLAVEAVAEGRPVTWTPPRVPVFEPENGNVAAAVDRLVEAALAPGHNQMTLRYGEVGADAVALARAEGVEIEGYSHVIQTSEVRHVLAKHGEGAPLQAGELPVTPADLARVPELVDTADSVRVEQTPQGRPGLVFTKRDGETTVVISEVRGKKQHLAFRSMRKFQRGGGGAGTIDAPLVPEEPQSIRPSREPDAATERNIAPPPAADNPPAIHPRVLDEAVASADAAADPKAIDALHANVARQVEAEDIQVPIDAEGTTKSARALLQEADDAANAAREIDGCANGGSVPE